jgi:disulfide bond formation protein DsbB
MREQHLQDTGFNTGVAVSVVFLVSLFAFVLVAMLGNRTHIKVTQPDDAQEVAQLQAAPTRITTMPTPVGQMIAYTGNNVSQGKSYFGASCSGCHGSDGRGIAGLGKNLVESEFVEGLNDQALHDFIVVGRTAWDPANVTGVDMPARGGNPALTDQNIYQIIAYLRTQADPSRFVESSPAEVSTQSSVAAMNAPSTTPPPSPTGATIMSQVIVALDTPIPTPTSATPFDAALAYNLSCAGCHGLDGRGIASNSVPGNGSDLFTSRWVVGGDTSALVNFIMTGKPPVNPEVAFPHPYSGDYPTLDEAQVRAVIQYIYTLPTR